MENNLHIVSSLKDVFSDRILRAVVSNPRLKTAKYKRAELTLRNIGGGEKYQIELFTDKQAFHKNIPFGEPVSAVAELISENGFRQLDAWSAESYYMLKISKKGKVSCIKKAADRGGAGIGGNNREKNYLLKQDTYIPPLVDLGVFTKDGRVVNSMYDKYRQINRFVELIDDVIGERSSINILDFGCGKSYLTFILYYYLTEIKNIKAHITGLDLKSDVIKKCAALAEKYGYDGLSFEVGDINGYRPAFRPDMIITLHACDTATDYALCSGIEWGADIIMSVPCCQHELNAQIKTDKLSALTDYGLIKERFSALATDAIRGKLLEAQGYRVQLLEFVDMEHSPKNLLIRAVRHNSPPEKRALAKAKAEALMEEFGFSQALYRLLYK